VAPVPAVGDDRWVSTALYADERVFESLYRLHRPVVFAYALARTRNVHDAEDVTQTTFLKAYNALSRGVQPRESGSWLVAIARNVCRDRLRAARRRPAPELLADGLEEAAPGELAFDPRDVRVGLAALEPQHRSVLLLRDVLGHSHAEISARLGVSEPAVKALLVRARRSLREELELGMTCPQARRALVRELNDAASTTERRALRRHLRRCPDCAAAAPGAGTVSRLALVLAALLPLRRLAHLAGGNTALKAAAVGTAVALGLTAKETGVVPGRGETVPKRPAPPAPAKAGDRPRPHPVFLPAPGHPAAASAPAAAGTARGWTPALGAAPVPKPRVFAGSPAPPARRPGPVQARPLERAASAGVPGGGPVAPVLLASPPADPTPAPDPVGAPEEQAPSPPAAPGPDPTDASGAGTEAGADAGA